MGESYGDERETVMKTFALLPPVFPLSALVAAASLGTAVAADARIKPSRVTHASGVKPLERQLPVETGSSSEGFRLYEKTAKPSLRPDEPIFVTIVQQNVTDSPLPFYDLPPEIAYDVQVTTPDGRAVPLTRFGRTLQSVNKHGDLFGFRLPLAPRIMLPANGAKGYTLQISRMFDMTVAGSYLVSVRRRIPTLDGKGHVELASYPLVISVDSGS